MINKKSYIKPMVSFESIEHESPLCDFSVIGPNQPGHNMGEAKFSGGFWDEGDENTTPLTGPIEAANNQFEYSMDVNW